MTDRDLVTILQSMPTTSPSLIPMEQPSELKAGWLPRVLSLQKNTSHFWWNRVQLAKLGDSSIICSARFSWGL